MKFAGAGWGSTGTIPINIRLAHPCNWQTLQGGEKMRKFILASALVAAASFGAANAQTTPPAGSATPPTATTAPSAAAKTRAQCDADWKMADKNNDGKLDKAEMDAAKSMVPVSLTSSATVSMQEFVAACSTAR
jgi:hypothetical protein